MNNYKYVRMLNHYDVRVNTVVLMPNVSLIDELHRTVWQE